MVLQLTAISLQADIEIPAPSISFNAYSLPWSALKNLMGKNQNEVRLG